MVRIALESVRADIRSIYGSLSRGKGVLQLRSETERAARIRCCFFRPEGDGLSVKFRRIWDLMQIVMLFYVALAVPFRIGFQMPVGVGSAAFVWEIVVDLYFGADIVINFRTAYYDPAEHVLVVDQRTICRKYLTSWFAIDLLSCIPVTYIELLATGVQTNGTNDESLHESGSQLKLFKVLRLFRLTKLLRLVRIRRVLQRLEDDYKWLAQGSRIMKIIITIMIVAHAVACMWYYAGSGAPQVLGKDENGEDVLLQPWVNRWLSTVDDASDISYYTRYLDALYYSVTTLTTVGYGDRVPNTDNEKLLSIFCELAGSVIFGIIAGSLSALAMAESLSVREIKIRRKQLEEFMHFKKVPKHMRKEFCFQMENWFSKKSVFDESVILEYLPPRHRKELMLSIYKPYLVQCPLLQGMETAAIAKLCLLMRPYLACVDDVIVQEGEIGEEMYLIMRGAVQLNSVQHPAYNARLWEDGAFFGELAVLQQSMHSSSDRRRHVYTATAQVETDCTYITAKDLDDLDSIHPKLKATMRKYALARAERFGYSVAVKIDGKAAKRRSLVATADSIQTRLMLLQKILKGTDPVASAREKSQFTLDTDQRDLVDRVVAERLCEIEHHMEILLDDAEYMREDAEVKEGAWKRSSHERSAV
jgi:CRP-like cAMP-binding protein